MTSFPRQTLIGYHTSFSKDISKRGTDACRCTLNGIGTYPEHGPATIKAPLQSHTRRSSENFKCHHRYCLCKYHLDQLKTSMQTSQALILIGDARIRSVQGHESTFRHQSPLVFMFIYTPICTDQLYFIFTRAPYWRSMAWSGCLFR